MSTTGTTLNLLFDKLSPYDVAVLGFTSPSEIATDETIDESPIVLTSKASYWWAGAVAHIFINRPALNEDEVLQLFYNALHDHADELRDIYRAPATPANLLAQQQIGLAIINSLLKAAGLSEEAADEIGRNTEAAVQRLQEAGLIEDPLKKWVRGALLSVALLIPVNFTSTTQDGEVVQRHIESVLVAYDQQQHGDQVERHIDVKVAKVVKVIKERLVPAIDDVVGDLAKK